MKIVTAKEMRQLEAAAVVEGMEYLRLMENAGSAAARVIRARYALQGRSVTVLCGRGNNGGDGFVIARKLLESGAKVTVALLCGLPASREAQEMLARIRLADMEILSLDNEPYRVSSAAAGAGLIVDAVFGIGFHGDLPDALRPLFRTLRGSGVPVVAVDVPSGINSDTGACDPDALPAVCTVTFTAMKPALLDPRAAALCGDTEVVSIGIDEAVVARFCSAQALIDADMVRACLPERPLDSHKGTYGRLLSVCGSYGMAGAAVLAARAALRTGAGLVTAALPRSVYPIAAAGLPEPVFLPLPETPEGELALAARSKLREQAARADAILLGCGLGTAAPTQAVVTDLLAQASCPVVLDADGINCIAGHIDIRNTAQCPLVLTPHPGEMARLTGLTVAQVQENRLMLARRFAEEQQVVLVLKGFRTVIAAPGRELLLNPTGNPGMATGGSGDVLAAMIASLLAQGVEPFEAAMCGVYWHGLAGDRTAAHLSQAAMLPSDLLEELGPALLQLTRPAASAPPAAPEPKPREPQIIGPSAQSPYGVRAPAKPRG